MADKAKSSDSTPPNVTSQTPPLFKSRLYYHFPCSWKIISISCSLDKRLALHQNPIMRTDALVLSERCRSQACSIPENREELAHH